MPPKLNVPTATAAAAANTASGVHDTAGPFHMQLYQMAYNLDQMKKAKAAFFASASCAGLFFVILFLYIMGGTSKATTARQVAIVFTDGGVDDMIALNYLLHRSDIKVPFVVATAGQGSPTVTYRNLQGFYSLSTTGPRKPKQPKIVLGAPFATIDGPTHNCTYRRALTPERKFSFDAVYGTSQQLRAARAAAGGVSMRGLFAAATAATTAPAAPPGYFMGPLNDFLAPLVPKSVVFVALGQLTDVAAFITSSPYVNRVRRIYVSGGVLAAQPSTGSYFGANFAATTYNLFLDPQAANVVLGPNGPSAPDATLVVGDAVAPLAYASAAPGIISNPPAGQPVDKYLAAALSAWSSRASDFATAAVPQDLAAAMMAASPKVKASASITSAVIGVTTSVSSIQRAGIVGATQRNATAVRVVTAYASPSLFWGDYFAITGAPWPV